MRSKNNARSGFLVLAITLSMVLVGCATPKPAPSWPSGQERPINKAPSSVESKEAK